MKTNVAIPSIYTHEGAKAQHINVEAQLRRSVMSCLLWEKEFYEDGVEIGKRIISLIPKVKPEIVADIAIEAREKGKLRHVPLLIVREMARYNTHKSLVASTLARVIQRADELTEFMALYWKDKKQPLSAQVKLGLASAFTKFDSYQLSKYDQDNAVKLRDVLFLCHAKPITKEQESLWKQLVDKKLEPPDTWEVALSTGKDKKETWERLLSENKLGALALLRNLRNMDGSGVNEELVLSALDRMKVERVLPFRFITAARYVPRWESALEKAMLKCLNTVEKLSGNTVLLVDVSGSMDAVLSTKSDLMRMDTACGLAMLLAEVGKCRVFTFSNIIREIPARHGFALRDAVVNSQPHGGTYLGAAVNTINKNVSCDRIIVLTDEQSHDSVPAPNAIGYIINIASAKNGVGYGAWTHIDGFSESVIDYIRSKEEIDSIPQSKTDADGKNRTQSQDN